MKGIFRKTLAAALALTIVGGGLPTLTGGTDIFKSAIVANATDEAIIPAVGVTIKFDEIFKCVKDHDKHIPYYFTCDGETTFYKTYGDDNSMLSLMMYLPWFNSWGIAFRPSSGGINWDYGCTATSFVDDHIVQPDERHFEEPIGVKIVSGTGTESDPFKLELAYEGDPLPLETDVKIGKKWYIGDTISTDAVFEVRSRYFDYYICERQLQTITTKLRGKKLPKCITSTVEGKTGADFDEVTIGDIWGDDASSIFFPGYDDTILGIKIVGGSGTEEDPFTIAPILADEDPLSDIKFTHNVSLGNDLSIVYYVPAADLEGCTDIKLTLKKEFFDASGNKTYKTTTINAGAPADNGYGNEYEFRYKGISAKEMGSNVTATLSVKKDGETFTSPEDVYSIKRYATNKLNKSGTPEKLKKLLVDMLNYGAQAQQYFGYNTGDLVNKSLTDAQKALATSFDTITVENHENVKKWNNVRARFTGKNLNLGNNIGIVYFMEFDSDVDTSKVTLQLRYTNALGEDKTLNIPYSSFTKGDYENELRYDFTGLSAKDSMQPIRAVIREDGVIISDVLYYSIPTYAGKKLANSTNESLKEIIRSMLVYYTSAKNYFA